MKTRTLLMGLLLALATPPALAELVVIAHPKSGLERLSHDEVVNIYLGRYRRLASGVAAEPIDHNGDTEIRALFYRKLVGKSLAEINAYWARLLFSGKTHPPLTVSGNEEAVQQVALRPGALAYVERSRADKRVIIVYAVGE